MDIFMIETVHRFLDLRHDNGEDAQDSRVTTVRKFTNNYGI